MRAVRVLLLLLLALLLPVRGVLAHAAHCAGSTDAPVAVAAADHANPALHAHGEAGLAVADSVHAAHHGQSPGAGELAAGAGDACGLCTVSCSATPLLDERRATTGFLPAGTVAFPPLLAPPPSHPSEGPERPPRTV